jgi:hypothetical protein
MINVTVIDRITKQFLVGTSESFYNFMLVFSSLTKIRLASLFSLTETPKNFAAAFAS